MTCCSTCFPPQFQEHEKFRAWGECLPLCLSVSCTFLKGLDAGMGRGLDLPILLQQCWREAPTASGVASEGIL